LLDSNDGLVERRMNNESEKMENLVIGIDLGTQGMKVIVYRPSQKKIVHTSSAPIGLNSHGDGTREQLTEWWKEAFHQCFASIPDVIKRTVIAIGVSGQQHGFVPLDKRGNVLAAVKLWCDTSTVKECNDLVDEAGGDDAYLAITGLHLKTGYTASKIRWLKDHHPELYAQLAIILLPHDYLNYYLTGNYCMECGDASGTGLLDVRNRCWSDKLIELLDPGRDLSTCFPPLIESNKRAGIIRPELAIELGLSDRVIISAGGGDNMMAAIGTGNITSGKLTASLGTSGTLFAFSDNAPIDTRGDIAAFCSSTGGWLPLVCTMNCTIATEQMRNLLKLNEKDIDDMVGSIANGCNGVLTLPFYNGERTPDLPNAKAVIFGLDNTNTTDGHLIRSAMESAIFGLKNGIAAFSRAGMDFEEITLTGGGSNSAVWRQLCADILNLSVKVLQQHENAAFGAALQGLWCFNHENGNHVTLQEITEDHLSLDEDKCCEPNEQAVKEYEGIYKRYMALIEAVTPLY